MRKLSNILDVAKELGRSPVATRNQIQRIARQDLSNIDEFITYSNGRPVLAISERGYQMLLGDIPRNSEGKYDKFDEVKLTKVFQPDGRLSRNEAYSILKKITLLRAGQMLIIGLTDSVRFRQKTIYIFIMMR